MRNDTLAMRHYIESVESKMSNYCTIWDTPTQALKITESITQVGDTQIIVKDKYNKIRRYNLGKR